MSKSARFMELEGLRGLAAVLVVLTHFAYTFYPTLLSGKAETSHTSYDVALFGTPFGLLSAGTFAVAIFFVLSGFVLSIGFFQTGDGLIVRKLASGRYLRLMLPALGSLLLAFILIWFGAPIVMNETAGITGSDWLAGVWDSGTSLAEVVGTAVVGIFVYPNTDLNNVLWTMQTELWGSFMVFGFLLVAGKMKYRWVFYLAALVLTTALQQVLITYKLGAMAWFSPFIIGMMLADAYAHGWLRKVSNPVVVGLMLIGGLLLGAIPATTNHTMYQFFGTLQSTAEIGEGVRTLMLILGASLVVAAVLAGRRTAGFLRSRYIGALGKYTFALYLTHLLVIYTFTCTVFVSIYPHLDYNLAAIVSILLSIPVIMIVTRLFYRYADKPSIALAKSVGRVLMGEQQFSLDQSARRAGKQLLDFCRRNLGIGEVSK